MNGLMIGKLNISRMSVDDLEHVNAILNHESIYPHVCGNSKEKIDARIVLENPGNYVLGHSTGIIMFIKMASGFYEFHTCVLPEARGIWVIQAGMACFEYMFTQTDAVELITRCPKSNLSAHAATKRAGLRLEFTTRKFWPTPNGDEEMDVYTLSIQHWTSFLSDVSHEGKWLHDRYDAEFKRLGMEVPAHPDDASHDKYVGVTVMLMKSGYIQKSIDFYNRYAVLGGYDLIHVVSVDPIILECAGIQTRLFNNDFEVIKCQQS